MNTFENFNQEPKINEVKKNPDGSLYFPVTHQTAMGDFINYDFKIQRTKEGKLTIENKTKITNKNNGYVLNKNAVFTLDPSNKKNFSQTLGKALDAYIGKWRNPVDAKKREKAYALLGYKEPSREVQELNELAKVKSELKELQNELPKKFSRDKATKTLTVEYNIGYGANEKVMYTSFQQVGDKVKFTLSSGYLWTFAKLENKEVSFNRNDLAGQVERYLTEALAKPLIYKKLIGKDTEYTMQEGVQQNAIKKAKDAANIFLKYSK